MVTRASTPLAFLLRGLRIVICPLGWTTTLLMTSARSAPMSVTTIPASPNAVSALPSCRNTTWSPELVVHSRHAGRAPRRLLRVLVGITGGSDGTALPRLALIPVGDVYLVDGRGTFVDGVSDGAVWQLVTA